MRTKTNLENVAVIEAWIFQKLVAMLFAFAPT